MRLQIFYYIFLSTEWLQAKDLSVLCCKSVMEFFNIMIFLTIIFLKKFMANVKENKIANPKSILDKRYNLQEIVSYYV